ncbi:MAG: hypothetical protein ACON5J_20355 [Rubripirellula sp.]
MSYSHWNDELLKYFFGSFSSDQPVRITITEELLDAEFEKLGGYRCFRQALIEGPEWPAKMTNGFGSRPNSFSNICNGLYRQWKRTDRRHQDYQQFLYEFDGPPYFNYLCALSLAWTKEVDGLRDTNFYDRLESIYPGHSLRQSLGELSHLWEGLEKWTQLHNGTIGWFQVEQLGRHAHVGIPKSQVILTPGKVDRTPGLFFDLALSPEDELDEVSLRSKVLKAFGKFDFLLGKAIYDEIDKNSELGRSALKQLLEHFEEWDGRPPIRQQSSREDAGTKSNNDKENQLASIVSGLEFIADLNSWHSVKVPICPDIPDGDLHLQINGTTYKSVLRAGTGTAFIDQDDETNMLRYVDVDNEKYWPLKWKNEFQGEREFVAAIVQPQKIECYDWTPDNKTLIQQSSLPSEGSCYCLIEDSMYSHFESWCKAANVKIESTIPQSGLGSSKIVLIYGIRNASSKQWAMFPDGGDSKRRRPKLMTLLGGSRQRRERATRTYLPFDLPILKLEAEGTSHADLICEHCSLIEINPIRKHDLPWATQVGGAKYFEIMPSRSATRISIGLIRNGDQIGRPIAFRLMDREDLKPVEEQKYKTDLLGERQPAEHLEGACGVTVPFSSNFPFENWRFATWVDSVPDNDSSASILMDWIASKGTISYSSLRNFVSKNLASDFYRTDLTNEVKALYNLGHVEIQTDSRARWSYIHGAPTTLYPLPFLQDGKRQYVLSGAFTISLVEKLQDECKNFSLKFDRHPQLGGNRKGHWLVPSRISVISDDLNEVTNLGRRLGVRVLDQPPAWSLANWCAGLDDWFDRLNNKWHLGAMPHAEASYRPLQYQTKSPKVWPEDVDTSFNLVRSTDAQTKRHFNYSLIRKQGEEFYNAMCNHKSWGIWYTHRHMILKSVPELQNIGIPIPYDPTERNVILPLELDPPPLISKALTLCSGFASLRITPDEERRHLTSEFGLKQYQGQCVVYRSVPESIANRLLKKLGAKPKHLCHAI